VCVSVRRALKVVSMTTSVRRHVDGVAFNRAPVKNSPPERSTGAAAVCVADVRTFQTFCQLHRTSRQSDIRPHGRRRRTVQSYSPDGINVPSQRRTLAPPGEYDLTRGSFGRPESTIQTSNRSVQPFLNSLQQCRRAYECPYTLQ